MKDNQDKPCYKGKKKLYGVWQCMKDRCRNPNSQFYFRYGGRGITVDPLFDSYDAFYGWALANGYKEGLEIDRIDNDKGYSPDNCRFVSRRENTRNRQNKSKYGPCIYRQNKNGGFLVRVWKDKALHTLGTFKTLLQAEEVRDNFLAGGYSH